MDLANGNQQPQQREPEYQDARVNRILWDIAWAEENGDFRPIRLDNLHHIGWRYQPRVRDPYNAEKREKAIRYREKHNYSYKKIAGRIGVGCSPATVRRWFLAAKSQPPSTSTKKSKKK